MTNQIITPEAIREKFGDLIKDIDEHDQKALLALAKEYFVSKFKRVKPKTNSKRNNHEQDH